LYQKGEIMHKMTKLYQCPAFLAAAALVLTVPAWADDQEVAPATGTPAQASGKTKEFLKGDRSTEQAGSTSRGSERAKRRTRNFKQFAQQMEKDYAQALNQVKPLAEKRG
jgi:hypothetical protein